MFTTLPALALLTLQTPPTPPAPAPASEVWTQAELERVTAEISAQVEVLRGQKYKTPVPVKITDKKGFFTYAKSRQDATQTPQRMQRDESVAKLLGLIPSTMDLEKTMLKLLEDQVGGFYDPESKSFYLMESFTGGVAKIILAHELTHALDDQYYDIDGTLKKIAGNTDAEVAFQAVVEGSGTGEMNQWFKAHMTEVSMEDLSRAQGMGADQLADAPPYLWKPLLAVYLRGDGFLTHQKGMNLTMKAATTDDVRMAFQSPPRSTEQILHPAKYWDEKSLDEPVPVAIDTSKLPAGWMVLGEDTLGELYLAMLTTPAKDRKGLDVANPMSMLGIKYTNTAAEGWGGDRLVLLGHGEDRMLQLVTVWDTLKDADEFASALGDPRNPAAIPVWAGAERDAKKGWSAGNTATDAIVSRETAANPVDGKSACVIVRVFSFAGERMKDDDVAQMSLPWKLTAAQSKTAEATPPAPK
jgi:hypothetical protein